MFRTSDSEIEKEVAGGLALEIAVVAGGSSRSGGTEDCLEQVMFRTSDSEIKQKQEGWHWGSDSSGSRKRCSFCTLDYVCGYVSGCTEGVQRGAKGATNAVLALLPH